MKSILLLAFTCISFFTKGQHNYTESTCDTGVAFPMALLLAGDVPLKFTFEREPTSFSLRVFDKTGTEVYTSDRLDLLWMGVSNNGNVCEAGIYNWIISYSYKAGELEKSCIGTVELYLEPPCEEIVYVPNIFTTCGDSMNDAFRPQFGCEPAEYKMQIFNRWGELIFQTHDLNTGWDATYKNTHVKTDTYIYRILYNYKRGDEMKELRGQVSVLR
ncbi:MAG TPA: gliding motility-associated C-terminal domain-containing protein [Flavobacteriales bacterium]|nr:gliding motility-associated C-terminal domain-containing protein [Flavobacteriales bacterium]